MEQPQTHVVWFKRDLRVHDHEPLARAAAQGPIIALYVCEPDVVWNSADHDPRHWGFVRECLNDLHASLQTQGISLTICVGNVVEVLEQLRVQHNVTHVWAHQETGNLATFARDKDVIAWARTQRVNFIEIPQTGVVRKSLSRSSWSKERERRLQQSPLHPPSLISGVHGVKTDELPPSHDAINRQHGGERHARQIFDDFLNNRISGYQKNISSPITAWDGCSRLSPYIAFGAISSREIISRVRHEQRTRDEQRLFSLRAFEDRMAWRDHFMQKLEEHPDLELQGPYPELDGLRTRVDQAKLDAWVSGVTGYPFVDACIRALQHTGWINFRMRAMLVSFAAFDLWLPWQSFSHQLARWFVDYEPGIHWSQIHMQSGVTANPTLRIYNPVKQSYDQDPEGHFIRQWIPELSHLDNTAIHEPWKYSQQLNTSTTVYSNPIVHHEHAKRLALQRIEPVRRKLGIGGRTSR